MRAETLDDYKRKDLLLDGIRNPTMKQVCYVVLTVRFQPEFLSRPPSGATLPPGEGIGGVPTVFPVSGPGRTAFGGRNAGAGVPYRAALQTRTETWSSCYWY